MFRLDRAQFRRIVRTATIGFAVPWLLLFVGTTIGGHLPTTWADTSALLVLSLVFGVFVAVATYVLSLPATTLPGSRRVMVPDDADPSDDHRSAMALTAKGGVSRRPTVFQPSPFGTTYD